MILVRSEKKLKKLLSIIPQKVTFWFTLGPCPDFINTPAVVFSIKGEKYVVLTNVSHFMKIFNEALDE
jgi:hypothetical protein